MDYLQTSLLNNMDIIERETLIELFDTYRELLTDKQIEYFENYYFLDLSLAEIAENLNVSRNAIHDMLKKTEQNLLNYESKLKINEKNKKILSIINNSPKTNELEEIQKIIEE